MAFDFVVEESNYVDGVFVVKFDSYTDQRGEIWTSYEDRMFPAERLGGLRFSHDKFVWNTKNVLRGLHGDQKSYKLVSCPQGNVFQVAADCRPNSKTYGKYHSLEISRENRTSMLLPPGVANGFVVLSNEATYHYKLAYPDDYLDYDKQFTIKYYDQLFSINWPVTNPIVSDRDA